VTRHRDGRDDKRELNFRCKEMTMSTPALRIEERAALVHTGNSLEALVAVASGLLAGSVSLVGFGFDSLIEVTSGAAILWRIHLDRSERRERAERVSLRIVGGCFLMLAAYVAVDAIKSLYQREQPARSIAVVSLIVMPLLSRSKSRVGQQLKSGAMQAHATQTEFCTYLSAILPFGLATNWLLGWWWADSTAALVMVPLIAKEGIDGLRAKGCC
jgi:divalent metal cation (Fe/Co/Zn/Cd) transporter